jgi:hypothetical protein
MPFKKIVMVSAKPITEPLNLFIALYSPLILIPLPVRLMKNLLSLDATLRKSDLALFFIIFRRMISANSR